MRPWRFSSAAMLRKSWANVAGVPGVVLDADPQANGVMRLDVEVLERDRGNLHAIHERAFAADAPELVGIDKGDVGAVDRRPLHEEGSIGVSTRGAGGQCQDQSQNSSLHAAPVFLFGFFGCCRPGVPAAVSPPKRRITSW